MHSETRRSSPAPRGHTQHPHLPGERKASAGPGGKPASSRGPGLPGRPPHPAPGSRPAAARGPGLPAPSPPRSRPGTGPGAAQRETAAQYPEIPSSPTARRRDASTPGGAEPHAPEGEAGAAAAGGGREHRSRRLPRWAGRHLGACGHPHRPPLTLLGNKKAPRHPVPGQVPPGPGASGPPGLRTPPGRARALPRGRSHEGPGHPRLGVEGPGSAGPGPRAPRGLGAGRRAGGQAAASSAPVRPRRRSRSGAGPRRPPAARGGGASTHTC